MDQTQEQSDDQHDSQTKQKVPSTSLSGNDLDLEAEVERLSRELAAAQQERSQSAAYGLELLNEKENLQHKYESIEALYEQSKQELQEVREAWNKAVAEQRVSATNVFEKEVQLMNDSDALQASFTHAKQEIEKELKQTKSQLDSAILDKDRYMSERDDLAKKVNLLEQERKALKNELKDLKGRETRLFNENNELEEENVSLQKQVSNLRSTQVEFESSKHEIQRLQDELVGLNSQLEEMVTLKRITERQMQEALEALQSEREQKYALRKELDKRNTADPLMNWTSLAALKGSPHLANLALRGFGSSGRDRREGGDVSPNGFGSDPDARTTFSDPDQSFDMMHDLDMPSIEGSLFDEVHLTEIKKLQQNLEDKENQRSNLNTKLIEVQHKLESKIRQADEIETKLTDICTLVEEFHNEYDLQKQASPSKQNAIKQQVANDNNNSDNLNERKLSEEVTSTTSESGSQLAPAKKSSILDDYDNIHAHLQALFAEFKTYQEMCALNKENISVKQNKDAAQAPEQSPSLNLDTSLINEGGDKKIEAPETLQSDDVSSLRTMLFKKHEQLKLLRTILKSNKESAEVALKNLKSKYDIEKAVVSETMAKLRLEHKRLNEDAATFASLRSHFSARIEEYNSEIEKLQSKLSASEQEKSTLNSLLRMAIEQKVMLTQKLEALEMEQESNQDSGHHGNNGTKGSPRPGMIRGRGGASSGSRNLRTSRIVRSNNPDQQRQR